DASPSREQVGWTRSPPGSDSSTDSQKPYQGRPASGAHLAGEPPRLRVPAVVPPPPPPGRPPRGWHRAVGERPRLRRHAPSRPRPAPPPRPPIRRPAEGAANAVQQLRDLLTALATHTTVPPGVTLTDPLSPSTFRVAVA